MTDERGNIQECNQRHDRRSALILWAGVLLLLPVILWLSIPNQITNRIHNPWIEESRIDPALVEDETVTQRQQTRFESGALASRLIVRATCLETGEPLIGVRPRISKADTTAEIYAFADSAYGTLQQVPRTDQDGIAEVIVPSDTVLLLQVEEADAHYERHEIEPLVPGESRNLSIALPTYPDRVHYLRIVQDEDGKPIADADISALKHGSGASETVALTDESGLSMLRYASWRNTTYRASYTGRTPRTFRLTMGHSSATNPQEVRLPLGATLVVRVVEAQGEPLPDCSVRVSTEVDEVRDRNDGLFPGSSKPLHWNGCTNSHGEVEFSNLPSSCILVVDLQADDGQWHLALRRLVLLPGKAATAVIERPLGALVLGLVVASGEHLVANREIGLSKTKGKEPRPFYHWDTVDRKAVSTDDGRFTFENVAPGTYHIGLAAGSDDYFPLARIVEIPPDTALVEVEILLEGASTIRGRVLDNRGRSVAGAHVVGVGVGFESFANGMSDDNGTFELANLAQGIYNVSASFPGSMHEGAIVEVVSGTRDVELVVPVTGSVLFRVVSSPDVGSFAGRIHLCSSNGRLSRIVMTQDTELLGVISGTYIIVAVADDGRVALSTLFYVEADHETNIGSLTLQTGARVDVRYYDGPEMCIVALMLEGMFFDGGIVERDTVNRFAVPPGTICVRFYNQAMSWSVEKLIAIEPGESEVVRVSLGSMSDH